MEFSTNRRLAVIVLIVVVCLFSVIGVNGSLAKLSDKIGQGFYDGVENRDGYVEKSIQSHLDNIADAANGLVTLGKSIGIKEADELSAARIALIEGKTVSEKFDSFTKVVSLSETVANGLLLSSRMPVNADALEYYASTVQNAARAIGQLGYNDTVDEYYNKTLRTFPVSLFRPFITADGPEYFR